MNCVDVSNWCVWFIKQLTLLRNHGGAQIIMERANFSCNQIGDHGVSTLVSDVFANFPPRRLLLFGNKITDPIPLEHLLASGALYEIHLSHNEISAASACRLVVTAANAKSTGGKYLYPIQGWKPLWMRLENNNFGEEFQVKLAENLCRARRPMWKAVCFVDGSTGCNTSTCHCRKKHVPALHLTYVGSAALNQPVVIWGRGARRTSSHMRRPARASSHMGAGGSARASSHMRAGGSAHQ
jgi:hypothetical protein